MKRYIERTIILGIGIAIGSIISGCDDLDSIVPKAKEQVKFEKMSDNDLEADACKANCD